MVIELLEGGAIAADHPEQVFGVTEEALGLGDVRYRDFAAEMNFGTFPAAEHTF